MARIKPLSYLLLLSLLSLFVWQPLAAQDESCPGAPPPMLVIGQQGEVTPGTPNNVRADPARSGEKVGEIPGGARFEVLDGPVCADGFAWWQVDYNGLIGWTVEGSGDDYFVLPVEPPPPLGPLEIELVAEFEYTGTVLEIAFSPDGRYIALAMGFATLRVMDAETLETVYEMDLYQEPDAPNRRMMYGLAWLPDSSAVAITLNDSSQVRYYSVPEGELLRSFEGLHQFFWDDAPADDAAPTAAAFTADGQNLITFGNDGFVRLWDVENGGQRVVIKQHPETDVRAMHFTGAGGLAISPDGSSIAYIYRDGSIYRWSLALGGPQFSPPAIDTASTGVQPMRVYFASDTELVYHASSAELGLHVYNTEARTVRIIPLDLLHVYGLAVGADGVVAVGLSDGVVRFYDLESGRIYAEVNVHSVRSLAFSPDGRLLVAGGGGGEGSMITVWRVGQE